MSHPNRPLIECLFQRDVAAGWPDTACAHLPIVLRADAVKPDEADLPHRHIDFCALYLVRQGRGIHVIDSVPYGVSRGDVYLMAPGVTHLYSSYDDLILDALYFMPTVFDLDTWQALADTPGFIGLFVEAPSDGSAKRAESGRWLHLSPEQYALVRSDLDEMHAEWRSTAPISVMLTRSLFLRLLARLSRLHAGDNLQNARRVLPSARYHEAAVADTVRYLDERYAEPLRIDSLAAMAFLSPDRFTEVFAAVMGRTPTDYLRHVRLERARALLTDTDLTISEIGMRVGFSEQAYFTRVFRAAAGMTPSQYRYETQRQ